jgi:hypothetical protein
MSVFDTVLSWFPEGDIHKPIEINRILQQYDFYGIYDLYLGYGKEKLNESTRAITLDESEAIEPLLVMRFTPAKQPIVDLLSEAILRCNYIDRYREDTYLVTANRTGIREKSVDVIVILLDNGGGINRDALDQSYRYSDSFGNQLYPILNNNQPIFPIGYPQTGTLAYQGTVTFDYQLGIQHQTPELTNLPVIETWEQTHPSFNPTVLNGSKNPTYESYTFIDPLD